MLASIWRAILGNTETSPFRILLLPILTIALLLAALRQYLLSSKKPKQLHELSIDVKSNLTDETDQKYDKAEDDSTPGQIRIKALCIHPIKSCRPIEVKRAQLTKTGFAYDRCFALATEKTPGDWKFISQRTHPGMALIEQHLWIPYEQSDPNHESVKMGGCLIVSFPDPDPPGQMSWARAVLEEGKWSPQPQVSFTVPLKPTADQTDTWSLRVKTFALPGREGKGLDYSDIPAMATILPKLKKYLKIPEREHLALFACTTDTLAPTDTNLAPLQHIGTPAQQCYTDEQPLHIINLPSVHAASQFLPAENQPLSARRFRPNIFLTRAPAYSEETWKRFRVLPRTNSASPNSRGPPSLSVVCRTARCTMPNVEPWSGQISYENPPLGRKKGKPQPSTMMVEHHMAEEKQANPAALGYMGVHCVVEDSSFGKDASGSTDVFVEVGDCVEVFETGQHYWGSTAHDY